jgi:hypothetical protein
LPGKILFANQGKVKAVYSFLSTGNFASAAMGIASFYLYDLLKLESSVENYYDKLLMENELPMKRIRELTEINTANLAAINPAGKIEENQAKWVKLYNYLTAKN